jgi:hypothetical protein
MDLGQKCNFCGVHISVVQEESFLCGNYKNKITKADFVQKSKMILLVETHFCVQTGELYRQQTFLVETHFCVETGELYRDEGDEGDIPSFCLETGLSRRPCGGVWILCDCVCMYVAEPRLCAFFKTSIGV